MIITSPSINYRYFNLSSSLGFSSSPTSTQSNLTQVYLTFIYEYNTLAKLLNLSLYKIIEFLKPELGYYIPLLLSITN